MVVLALLLVLLGGSASTGAPTTSAPVAAPMDGSGPVTGS